MDHLVEFEDRDQVAWVRLVDERSRNSLSRRLLDDLADACTRAAREEYRALVITSSGRVFCSGGDLAGLSRAVETEGRRGVADLLDQFHGFIRLLRSLPMPTVAAVNGAAIGAGTAMAMACDVRVAAESAYFTTGYLAVGATPDGGASFHLARALGEPRALSSFLLNRRFPADELFRVGLVDRLVGDDQLESAGVDLAKQLGGIPSEALLAARHLVYRASGHSLDEHLDAERESFLTVSETDQFRAAVAQFTGNGNK